MHAPKRMDSTLPIFTHLAGTREEERVGGEKQKKKKEAQFSLA